MSAVAVSTAVGEDGVRIAVEALKEIASTPNCIERERVAAAQLLLQYGLAFELAGFDPRPS